MLPDIKATAYLIAEKLGEKETQPRQQIEYLVWALGQVQAWAIMLDAIELDQREGMYTCGGRHRRTVGGVFFTLAYRKGEPLPGRHLFRPKRLEH